MQEITLNTEQGLYVIKEDYGYSCRGFQNAYEKACAVAEWLALPMPSEANIGTIEGYQDYSNMMKLGALHNSITGERCNADLTPEFIGLEGYRIEVTLPDKETTRFIIGKSMGGVSVYFPKGSTFRVIKKVR